MLWGCEFDNQPYIIKYISNHNHFIQALAVYADYTGLVDVCLSEHQSKTVSRLAAATENDSSLYKKNYLLHLDQVETPQKRHNAKARTGGYYVKR